MLYTTHDVGEADRHADRVLVLADGELLYIGTPGRAGRRPRPRDRVPGAVRWLLIKDLRILRRSPLLVGLLILYPVVVAVLIGAALTGGPGEAAGGVREPRRRRRVQPRRPDARRRHLHLAASSRRSTRSAVKTRAEAIAKVRNGEALAALVIPADAIQRLQGMLSLAGGEPPTVEVFYNAEDPVKRRYVESTIRSRLADADAALSDAVLAQSAKYLDLVVKGGKLSFPLVGEVQILGLRNAQHADRHVAARACPQDAPQRAAAAAGQPLRPARGREPRPEQADPGLDRPAGAGQADRGQRLQDAARPVRGRASRRRSR